MSSPNKSVQFIPFLDQNYEELQRHCLESKTLFTDPKFPPEQALFPQETLIWRRPYDVTEHPQFFLNTPHRRDPGQGELSDCWFVVAIANLTCHEQIFRRVVPLDQTFDRDRGYTGLFHFRFWQFGLWYDVVIDDFLPFNRRTAQPWCSWNRQEPEEFWVALIEKAYAKINGGYQNLNGGAPIEAFTDLTAGVEQRFKLDDSIKERKEFFRFLLDSLKHSCLMACSINPQRDGSNFEEVKSNGLVVGHSYSVTAARYLQLKDRLLAMIRLRNPWANETEWAGAWNDRDQRWRQLDSNEKRRMSWQESEDGEFWMTFDDFFQEFDILEICHLSPDTFEEELHLTSPNRPTSSPTTPSILKDHQTSIQISMPSSLTADYLPVQRKTWSCLSFEGQWTKHHSSGGRCVTACEHGCNYWTNPQYEIAASARSSTAQCAIVVSLMQKYNRLKSTENPLERYDYIQARIYRIVSEHVAKQRAYLDEDLDYMGYTGSYVNRREVTSYLRVAPGRYLIIPSTYEPNRDGHFLLRVFVETNSSTAHPPAIRSPASTSAREQVTRLTIAQPVSAAPRKRNFCPFDCSACCADDDEEIHFFHAS